MKSREIIDILEKLIEEHGDCEMGMYDQLECEFLSIDNIKPRYSGGMDKKYFDNLFFGIANYEIGDWNRQLDYINDPYLQDTHYGLLKNKEMGK